MLQTSFSNDRLFQLAKKNYNVLLEHCNILQNEGYWEKPETLLHKPIHVILDLYLQSVLINLSIYCGKFHNDERLFIMTLPNNNEIECSLDDDSDEEVILLAKKMMTSPPILIQLCSLRDYEKQTNVTPVFFDCMLNIILAMAYLNNSKDNFAIKFVQDYYEKLTAFINPNDTNQIINPRYVFKKICNDDIEGNMHPIYSNARIQDKVVKKKKETSPVKENMIDLVREKFQEEQLQNIKEELNVHNNDVLLESLLEELNSLIGLDNVKNEINSLINLIKVRKLRESYDMPVMDMTYHMVFTGNPGTGKTTVARLVSRIYKELGLLSEGNLIEIDRSGLVAGYVGQTALKVKEVVEKAIGGVLFIDEAYSLTNNVASNDFGGEAIDTLVKLMEDHRDNLVIIVAGYHEEMEQFLKSNTGLVSRFNKFIEFPDYTNDELIEILVSMAKSAELTISEDTLQMLNEKLTRLTKAKKKLFGNGRGVRNLFEKIVVNQANRIVSYEVTTKEMLSSIIIDDIVNVI